MLCAECDISIKTSHVMGSKNQIADLLSRWDASENHKNKLYTLVPNHIWVDIEERFFHLDFEI